MKIYFHHSDGTLEHARGQFPHSLSPRECQVSSLVAAGLSDKVVAHILSLSIYTVKQYIRSARMKFRAPNRVALAVAYIRLVPPDPPAPALRKVA